VIRVDACAKVTLSLQVVGRRPDGYHDLDALTVAVTEPHDTLEIQPASATLLTVDGPFAAGVPVDESNLVWRALDAIGAHADVRLHKGIPNGAGLGGGSADAAAVLRAFDADPSIATRLGADVPFCLRGGAARVRGVGDVLEAVDQPQTFVVIATPRFACVTADVYRAWDELGGPHDGPNELEAAALLVEPRLAELRRAIEDATGIRPVLAGSGSSYAVAFDDLASAQANRARISGSIEASTWVGATCPAGGAANGSS
jgi:4-diphosphocytidyl-2-C-methyl-D-erythritol kinase